MNAIVLPTNLPNAATARLPELYEGAKAALAQCERIDECKDWGDKMAAMASYARQAKDESLERTARRIRARAVDRCGALLKSIPKGTHAGPGRGNQGESVPLGLSPRQEAARAAGLSRDEVKQAIRVNNVSRDEFERRVESAKPPTVTELAELGKRQAPKGAVDLRGRDPQDFKVATRVLGQVREMLKFCQSADADPAAGVRGSSTKELHALRAQVLGLQGWLTTLLKEIDRPKPTSDGGARSGRYAAEVCRDMILTHD